MIAEHAADQNERAEQQCVGYDHPLQGGESASKSCWIAGSATLTAVASMMARLEPLTVAARTQISAKRLWVGAACSGG